MNPSLQARPIRILSPAVAERIAAGEVIERPASVVKELVENSLDAGATEVAVYLEAGGRSLIEVVDNGCGMTGEDLKLAVQRHATSKLSSLDDLEKIHTLGFRGEALPSVSAVSDLTVVSRAVGQADAYQFIPGNFGATQDRLEKVTFGHFLNSPHGTRITARGLFSQVPARLKFLKAQATEVSQVREWVERLAISHPKVAFRLVSDGRTLVQLRPAEEAERVLALLSDGESYPVVSREYSYDGIFVRAHWVQGLSSPQMRRLIQVVNGRVLKDRMLQQAILSPFRQALLPGQFPAIGVFIQIDPAELDMNVHPTKTEIRFLDSRKAFHAVESLVATMIAEHGAPAFAAGVKGEPDFSATTASATPAAWSLNPPQNGGFGGASSYTPMQQRSMPWQLRDNEPARAPESSLSPAGRQSELALTPASLSHPLSHGRWVGTLFQTYLAYDLGQELALVDQHAAHERIQYEKLRKRVLEKTDRRNGAAADEAPHQALLIPEAVRFLPEQRQTLEPRLAWLAPLGFEAELFSEDTVLFRAIPIEWENIELRTRLKGLVDRLLAFEPADDAPAGTGGPGSDVLLDERLFETLASEACHSAVRAGDRLSPEQAESLVTRLFECEHPWNCPHGRPTVARVPRARLEEWFQRRV